MGAWAGAGEGAEVTALDPDSCRVDERSQRDRLAFAADFASLVQYYDLDNQPAGDWQRFLLKDPAILMAAISKADPGSFYTTFAPGRLSSNGLLQSAPDPLDTGLCDQLCTLAGNMLVLLDLWYRLLGQASETLVLRAFIENRIEATLGSQLKTLLVIQQALSVQTNGQVRAPQDMDLDLDRFDPFWRRNGQRFDGRSPGSPEQALRGIYQVVYGVFTQVVDYAGQAFERCRLAATPYPDTALLRVFSRLMDSQQAQINRLGREHLDFYYRRVLLQAPQPAEADQVPVCLQLSPKASSLALPAGTAFTAGKAADGSEILYVSEQLQVFDQASVTQVLALRAGVAGQRLTGPLRATLPATGWAPFEGGDTLRPGFALASPMLLLQAGRRLVDITLGLAGDGFVFADDTCYWLSTAKGWISVVPEPSTAPGPGQLALRIALDASTAPIVACAGLDGIDCPWPMLKVELGASQALQAPPQLLSVTVQVQVEGASAQVLANDAGPLPGAGSVQPFGPAPVLGQSFYLGSNEWGAKPVTGLGLSLQWEGLPDDLGLYYATYNDYLQACDPPQPALFDNAAFKAEWALRDASGWQVLLDGAGTGASSTPLFPARPLSTFDLALPAGRRFNPDPAVSQGALPGVEQGPPGYVRLQLAGPAPAFGHALYGQVLAAVSQANAEALIRQAKARPDGLLTRLRKAFGRAVQALRRWVRRLLRRPVPAPQPAAKDPNALQPLPNPPLSPTLAAVQVGYSASSQTRFPGDADTSPATLYHYGAFGPSLAYAAGQPWPADGFPSLVPEAAPGLMLYPAVAGGTWLYLALDNVLAPCSLSLLLALYNPAARALPGPDRLTGYAWSGQGWRALEVLQDGTSNFNRSGIVRLRLPECLAPSPLLPGAGVWLALCVPPQAQHLSLSWVQAQALNLRRADTSALLPGELPRIVANCISAPQRKIDGLAGVVQPLASRGGRAAEGEAGFGDAAGFYPRVSRRLRHKDRASSQRDYTDMAHEACPSLYHAVLLAGSQPGEVRLGLVNGYASAQEPGAFAPQVAADDLLAIQQHLQRRASAMARVGVDNLSHQSLKVEAQLVLATGADSASVLEALDLRLRLYLSPWIAGPQPRMSLAKGLDRAELAEVIAGCHGVQAVVLLTLWLAPLGQGEAQVCLDDPLFPAPGALLVNAAQHALSVAGGSDG